MAVSEHRVWGGDSEQSIDAQNQFMRSQPWYADYLQSIGQNPASVKLTESQRNQLLSLAQANGFVVDQGDIEVDPAGNFNPIGHKLRNGLLAAGIGGAAALTGGAALGAFGGAGAAGSGSGGLAGLLGSGAVVPSAALGAGGGLGGAAATAAGGGTLSALLKYGIPAAGTVVDDVLSHRANNQANDYLQGATTEAQALQQRLYDQTTGTAQDTRERNTALYQPFQQAGQQSLAALMGLANQNREDFHLPTLAEAQAMPGYQFGLDTGLKGVDHSAAARGGLLTGGAVKAADRYATDYATSKYGELVNQKLAEYTTNTANFDRPFNRNLALMGAGQYGTTGMANAGSDYADQVGRAGTAYTNASTDLVTGAANANAQTTLNNSNGDRRTAQNLADLFREYFGRA